MYFDCSETLSHDRFKSIAILHPICSSDFDTLLINGMQSYIELVTSPYLLYFENSFHFINCLAVKSSGLLESRYENKYESLVFEIVQSVINFGRSI